MTAEQNGWVAKFQIGWKNTNPIPMAATRARTALSSRLRSSRRCSMSGMRPSGSPFLAAAIRRELAMRAPLAASPILLAMAGTWGSARLLVRGHCRLLVSRPLELLDLLLQAVDPGLVGRLVGHLLRGGGPRLVLLGGRLSRCRRRRGRGRGRRGQLGGC